jgi:lytic murein transglycosylase
VRRAHHQPIAPLAWALSLSLALGCGSGAAEHGAARGQHDAWIGGSEGEAAPAKSAAPPIVAPVPLEACGQTEEGFDGWLVSFRRHAGDEHVSARTIAAALDGVAYDAEIVELDRGQQAFKVGFDQFAREHVTPARVARGRALLKSQAAWLAEIERRFGVPRELLVAIWGLETDFGDNPGSRSCLRALATLAYDCRRPARFRDELMSALRIVERGDLVPERMLGAWAGEMGQTQFLPSSYEKFAIDFDGDGHADLVGSSQDALASTANYLHEHGFRAGEPYAEGSPNFAALGTWNASPNYVKAVALFAAKLAPPKRGAR